LPFESGGSPGLIAPRPGSPAHEVEHPDGHGRPRAEAKEAPAEFVKAFADGRAPMRLKLICRDVAVSKLDWTDRESWPDSIR
jgi:hypothetical protein